MNMEDEKMPVVVNDTEQDALINLDVDNVLQLAEKADKMVTALDKIMYAALRITSNKDWILIGGTPYLQESGATKVARLFGISWEIVEGYPQRTVDASGYPAYTYRMRFRMGSTVIECDGSRAASDDFFAGKKTDKNGNPLKQKSPDAIDLRNVKLAAYTNCLNNGIKRILPGLRNLDINRLEEAGIKPGGGYTFKEGSKGGTNQNNAAESGIVCEMCGKPITQKVASYSQGKFNGHKLCIDCQKKIPVAQPQPPVTPPEYDAGDIPPMPPFPPDEPF